MAPLTSAARGNPVFLLALCSPVGHKVTDTELSYTPCHRHMVIATDLSSLFDLLHCSIPQTRTECCLEFGVVSGYRMFLGLSGSVVPFYTVVVGRAMQGSPPISQHQKGKSKGSMADRPGLEPAFCGLCAWCISGMLHRWGGGGLTSRAAACQRLGILHQSHGSVSSTQVHRNSLKLGKPPTPLPCTTTGNKGEPHHLHTQTHVSLVTFPFQFCVKATSFNYPATTFRHPPTAVGPFKCCRIVCPNNGLLTVQTLNFFLQILSLSTR